MLDQELAGSSVGGIVAAAFSLPNSSVSTSLALIHDQAGSHARPGSAAAITSRT
jgi:hypothetical protein